MSLWAVIKKLDFADGLFMNPEQMNAVWKI